MQAKPVRLLPLCCILLLDGAPLFIVEYFHRLRPIFLQRDGTICVFPCREIDLALFTGPALESARVVSDPKDYSERQEGDRERVGGIVIRSSQAWKCNDHRDYD